MKSIFILLFVLLNTVLYGQSGWGTWNFWATPAIPDTFTTQPQFSRVNSDSFTIQTNPSEIPNVDTVYVLLQTTEDLELELNGVLETDGNRTFSYSRQSLLSDSTLEFYVGYLNYGIYPDSTEVVNFTVSCTTPDGDSVSMSPFSGTLYVNDLDAVPVDSVWFSGDEDSLYWRCVPSGITDPNVAGYSDVWFSDYTSSAVDIMGVISPTLAEIQVDSIIGNEVDPVTIVNLSNGDTVKVDGTYRYGSNNNSYNGQPNRSQGYHIWVE